MITSLTFSDDARGISWQFWGTPPANPPGVVFQGLDVVGTIRESSEDVMDADGSFDDTEFVGAAAVTLLLNLPAGSRALLDQLDLYCSPRWRPWLTVSDSEWTSARRLGLRFDSKSKPIELGVGRQRKVQVQFKAPRGLWEDTTVSTYQFAASAPDITGFIETASAGFTETAAAGFNETASQTASGNIITVPGTGRANWKARLYGPATGPKLTRDDTGEELNFYDTLIIPAGQYIELDSAARTARFLSDPTLSRLSYLNFPASRWFSLDGGTTPILRYHAASGTTASSVCVFTFIPTWMP